MKTPLIALGALLLGLSHSALAEDMAGMTMDDMSMDSTQQAPTASAEGSVRAIDAERHLVTLAHGPVAALHWPPMTMAFKATAAQLDGLKVGDKVSFEFRNASDGATLVNIRKP
ncbi:copper-binding protein [Pseudomonas nitroreducens]|uniref:copper-binding protein n=1 Tax=Pseudomonas nitroreducens TaxID=46680 RepID=UPI00265B5503|nr:copper-binding protein [Pseudomonas nitroreducens]MCP1651418.1 Cu(I)/Ag(I) efflux system protein CusF [Pseudomonas nitroreducens]MCP1689356.1 Cu(I)/Ag(I) efflux system protein CusF [Pseudomonas nitroreducens]